MPLGGSRSILVYDPRDNSCPCDGVEISVIDRSNVTNSLGTTMVPNLDTELISFSVASGFVFMVN
jgi:hypothetical protein